MRLLPRRTSQKTPDEPLEQPAGTAAVELRDVSRSYGRGRNAVQALVDVSERFEPGSFTAIMGPSGSGKSTLIQCAAGLDAPSSGTVWLGDVELSRLKEPKLTQTRRRSIGFVFQAFNLLPALTARQNIVLPVTLDGASVDEAWFQLLVHQVGIEERTGQRPAQLSGGQQQRVAIARALITRPRVVFADEPTGALDRKTALATLELLRSTVDTLGQTLIMVTHDPVAASYADRVLFLADGQIVGRMEQASPDRIGACLTQME